MHIILIGESKVGKTTVAWRLGQRLRLLGFSTGGFIIEETAEGLLLCNLAQADPIILAHPARPACSVGYCEADGYFFLVSALRFAGHMLRWPSDLVVIDEVGRWEALREVLDRAIDKINSCEVKHSIAVVRKAALSQIISKYRREPMIIEVTLENREQVYQAIFDRFRLFTEDKSIGALK